MKLYRLNINGNLYEVNIKEQGSQLVQAVVNDVEYQVKVEEVKNTLMPALAATSAPSVPVASAPSPIAAVAKPMASGASAVTAPIPGQIKAIYVQNGDTVAQGQKLLMMEAMKMENMIFSDYSGTVQKVHVNVGDSVGSDQLLVQIA